MKLFFGISDTKVSGLTNVVIDEESVVDSSEIGSETRASSIEKSVLVNVRSKFIEANGAILINVTASKIVAQPGSIIYNVIDDSEEGLVVEAGQVLAGVFRDDGSQIVVKSLNSIDGGKYYFECHYQIVIHLFIRKSLGNKSRRK